MTGRKRRGSLEINLTSLLDVLFCILFIVMLGYRAAEAEIKDEAQQNMTQMQEQISGLEKQITVYENKADGYGAYYDEVVIIIMENILDGNTHRLCIYKGEEPGAEPAKTILLNDSRTGMIKEDLGRYIEKTLETSITDLTDKQIIFVLFQCDHEAITHNEYNAIIQVLNDVQENHKEIFYKEVGSRES